MKGMMDSDVPDANPGLITYDSFWSEIRSNPVFKAAPGISEVVRVSGVLEDKIQSSFPKAKLMAKPLALRIIRGLSIQRLTTGDIAVAMGPTPSQLRDQLMLFHPMAAEIGSNEPASDLLTLIDATIGDMLKTVNGQFLTRVPGSDQLFLDVAKDVDYDAVIDNRAESLDEAELDTAFFKAVAILMERVDDTPYVTGHKIWQHEIEWAERNANRSGYLFFGTPNERPTAQPDRDFYLYFIQPFDKPKFRDDEREDEVFFRLADKDQALITILRRFSAAMALASINTGAAKNVYAAKADEELKLMRGWLKERQLGAFSVSHRGKSKLLGDWGKQFSVRERARLGKDELVNFRDYMNVTAAYLLAAHFQDRYPEYPKFGTVITELNRRQTCANALKAIGGSNRTKDATMILEALRLLDGDRIDPTASPYAQEIKDRLAGKGAGQVLNRQEIFDGTAMVETFAPGRFGLEPEFVAVVLAALVHSGEIVLAVPGAKIDAAGVASFSTQSIDDIVNFKHIETPKGINVALVRAVFELFGLSPGIAQAAAMGDDGAVRDLQTAVTKLVGTTLEIETGLAGKLTFWDAPVLPQEQIDDAREKSERVRKFAEGLVPYNTPGKLRNLKVTLTDVQSQADDITVIERLGRIISQVAALTPDAAYLAQAVSNLKDDDPWSASAKKLRGDVLGVIGLPMNQQELASTRKRLTTMKGEYATHYLSLHGKTRLGMKEDKTKASLISDPRLKALDALSSIPILPQQELDGLRSDLGGLNTCASLIESDLAGQTRCRHCGFTPKAEQLSIAPASSTLISIDDRMDKLMHAWTSRLREEFQDPIARAEGLELIASKDRDRVAGFADGEALPDPLDAEFVKAMRDALAGLTKVEITASEMRSALLDGGSPITTDDIRKRFNQLIAGLIKGKDEGKVRFVITEGAN